MATLSKETAQHVQLKHKNADRQTERQTCVHTPLMSLVLRESRTFKSMSLM